MGSRILMVVCALVVGAAPASGLQIEYTDVTSAATLIVTDGSLQDEYGPLLTPDGVVGALHATIGDFVSDFVRCRETIVAGASIGLVIEQSSPAGGLTNIAGPNVGEAGARVLHVDCRSSAIIPPITNWRALVHYVGHAQDDSPNEVGLPTHLATATANADTEFLATVYGPSIVPPVAVVGQPVEWKVRSVTATDVTPPISSVEVHLSIVPRGADRVVLNRVKAIAVGKSNPCISKKLNCTRKKVKSTLRCYAAAESHGLPVSQSCLDRAADQFNGGPLPGNGCFERLETKQPPASARPCATYDDQAAAEAVSDGLIANTLVALGTPAQNDCAARKKTCVSQLHDRLLNCHKKANTTGRPVDIACVQKAMDRFTGGAIPGSGCFARLEARYPPASATPCLTFGDATPLAVIVTRIVDCLQRKAIDPSGCPCVEGITQGCGLPRCKDTNGQRPDCTYAPAVTDPYYGTCRGPLILVDRTHDNFHNVAPESPTHKGRYWGFAKLLMADGYDVRDSATPFSTLLPSTTAKILVIANARPTNGSTEALSAADIAAVVNWVDQGGSLLLVIDHPPLNFVGALLQGFGLVRFAGASADPPCILPNGPNSCRTFTRATGTLNPSAVVANGFAVGEDINQVSTFTGTAVSLAASPPLGAAYEGVLIFPAGTIAGGGVNISGFWQGVAIQFGSGKVYVQAEASALSAQVKPSGMMGMQITPDNEQYLRNIIHWLD